MKNIMKLTAILSLLAGSAFAQGRPPMGGGQQGGSTGESRVGTQNAPRSGQQPNTSGQPNNNRMERQENRQDQRQENRDEKRDERKQERKKNRQERKNERMERRSGAGKVDGTNAPQPSTNNAN